MFDTKDDVKGNKRNLHFKIRDFEEVYLQEVSNAIRSLDSVYQPETDDPLEFMNGKSGITSRDLVSAPNVYSDSYSDSD